MWQKIVKKIANFEIKAVQKNAEYCKSCRSRKRFFLFSLFLFLFFFFLFYESRLERNPKRRKERKILPKGRRKLTARFLRSRSVRLLLFFFFSPRIALRGIPDSISETFQCRKMRLILAVHAAEN